MTGLSAGWPFRAIEAARRADPAACRDTGRGREKTSPRDSGFQPRRPFSGPSGIPSDSIRDCTGSYLDGRVSGRACFSAARTASFRLLQDSVAPVMPSTSAEPLSFMSCGSRWTTRL